MDIVQKAKEFATEAHKDQVRHNEEKTPYFFHIEEVAEIVESFGGNDEEIAAAWLHDTIEDTKTTIEDIEKQFGKDIAEIVCGLTDLPGFSDLPTEERKIKQAERVAKESNSIKKVKLADQISNVIMKGQTKSISNKDKGLVYIKGAKKIAEACKEASTEMYELFKLRYQEAHEKINKII